MSGSRWLIASDGTPARTKVHLLVDGERIDVTHTVRAVSFSLGAGDGSADVRVELVGHRVDLEASLIDGVVEVEVEGAPCGFEWGDGVVEPVQRCRLVEGHVTAHVSASGALRRRRVDG